MYNLVVPNLRFWGWSRGSPALKLFIFKKIYFSDNIKILNTLGSLKKSKVVDVLAHIVNFYVDILYLAVPH